MMLLTLPTLASATQPVPATLTAVLTIPVCAKVALKNPARASVVQITTPLCRVSVMINVVSMETAALTMMRSVVEEVEAACLIKTS